MNQSINASNHIPKLTLTCVKLKTSHAKLARGSDISPHYAKQHCPGGENHSHSDRKKEASHNRKSHNKQEEFDIYKNSNKTRKKSRKKKK